MLLGLIWLIGLTYQCGGTMGERIIQLASNLSDLSDKKLKGLFKRGFASEKLDGVWMAATCVNGDIEFLSSTLEKYISFKGTELEETIRTLHIRGWTNFVLIGEVFKEGMAQQVISGIARTETKAHADALEFHVHDMLQIDDWVLGHSQVPYAMRLEQLTTLLGDLPNASLKVIPQTVITSKEEFISFSKAIKLQGGEGACYREEDAEWQSGNRGTNLIRDKQKITYDLVVTGVKDVEEGERGGLKGVITVRWRAFGKLDNPALDIPIRGMSHAELRAWDADNSLIVGKVVEVEAMTFTNLGMLREPRYKFIREDKEYGDL
jgi:ATP-dependent DNA ligase